MSCRVEEGGSPCCKLGGPVKTVEIRGKSLESIIISRERGTPYAEADELNRPYELFIVIESPSKYDDMRGGIGFTDDFKKLIEFTKRAGFHPDTVFVSFMAKCNPPKRKPTVQEVKACLPYIYKEIELTEPKVIMTLGSSCLRLFSLHNKGGLNSVRGSLIVKALPLDPTRGAKQYNIIPSFDLGFFRYSGDPKVELRAQSDYRKAKEVATYGAVDNKVYKTSYKLIKSVDEIVELCENLRKEKFFAFDTESRGLPWSREPMMCLSFCWGYDSGKTQCAIVPIYQHDPDALDWKLKKYWNDADYPLVRRRLEEVFEDPTISKAAHNAKYDINTVRKHLNIVIKGFIFDSMLMHHALNEKKPHSLEYLADLEFGTGDYSSELHDITGRGKVLKATYDNIPDKILWPYAANDAECCWRLAKLYYNEMQALPHLWDLYCTEIEPLTYTLADAEWHGHFIDQKTLDELIDDYTTQKTNLLNKIRNTTWDGFNPSSPNHVRNAIIQMGHREDILDPKKVQGYNTSKEVLLELKEKIPLADHILKYRNTSKILGTYLENVKLDLDKDSRVRYFWMIHGTESARLSCRFYHQLPRTDKKRTKDGLHNVRDMLVAAQGHTLVYFDYSQIELRVLAILAHDEQMIRIFEDPTADIHAATAALLLNCKEDEVSDFNRQLGKSVNFGLAYGSEGYRLLQTGTWKDENDVEHPINRTMLNRGMDAFHQKFQGVSAYLASVPQIAKHNNGVYRTPFGRERHMGLRLRDKDEAKRNAAEREIVNFSIQSTAAAITIRTLNLVDGWIKQWREKGTPEDDVFLVNTVHDSGVWEVENHFVDFFKKNLRVAAERKIPELSDKSFPCAVGVGKSWSDAEANAK